MIKAIFIDFYGTCTRRRGSCGQFDGSAGKLLKQIQKYAAGKLVYIPATETKRDWGESTGYQKYLLKRNSDIRL